MLLSSIQPVASKAARSPLPVTSYDNFLKTVRGLHAGWGGLVASFAEGMGAPVLRNARVVEDGSFQDAMTSSRRLDGGPAVVNAMFPSESACSGIEGLRCVHAISLPITCFTHRREGAWDRLLP